MSEFDYRTISDEAVRIEYKHLLLRGKGLSQSIHRAYGAGRKKIVTTYTSDHVFNAFAGARHSRYFIELSSSIPLFLLILFGRLMSEGDNMPFIDTSGALASDYTLPAIVDPVDFNHRAEWKIELNPIRAFMAGTLADLCSTFILCHEFGHIISGHIEGLKHYDGEDRIAELTSRARRSKDYHERRQTWEYDADAVAVTLTLNFIAELISDTKTNSRTAGIFNRGNDTPEHVLSITVSALFAVFCYMSGIRHELNLESTHPHPTVRSHYVKDMLFQAADKRWRLDLDTLDRFADERFGEIVRSLEKIELFNKSVFTKGYGDQIDDQCERLSLTQQKYRDSCAEWAWISWE